MKSLLLLSSALCALSSIASADPVSHSSITPPVNEAVGKLIVEKKLAGAVTLVAQGGKVIHLQAHGTQTVESDDPIKVDSIFRIHSMTKAIVSAAALKLHEEKKFALTDPVSKFIPAFAKTPVYAGDGKTVPVKNAMTVEDLFRHTSGLVYGWGAPGELKELYSDPKLKEGSLEDFCNGLAEIPLVFQPGEKWVYGYSTDVLGRVVEVCSGMPLDEYLQKEFFDPLGMKDTGFWIESKQDKERFLATNQTTKEGVKEGKDTIGLKYHERPELISGGGGLVSTAQDYYKFLQMIADNGKAAGDKAILKPESVAMMTSNRLPKDIPNISFGEQNRTAIGFGLGFSVVTGHSKGWDEDAREGEFGWGGAASCHYWVSPKDDRLIVITLEQTFPYNWNMERAVKPIVYGALKK